MDRYQRVEKPRAETPISQNEIRITTQGMPRNYITYATTLLRERGASEIVLKAMGRAISKTVTITEIIKRRIAGLHQNTQISSADITYMWEPLEEGLLPLETTRHVSMITITLSTVQLDLTAVGYQPPLPADQVKPLAEYEYDGEDSPRGGRGRGRGRGRGNGRGGNGAAAGYQNGAAVGYYNGADDGWNHTRGRGRGRGRGFFGRGRGFYGSAEQEYGNSNDYSMGVVESAPRGRGRGRGRSGGNAKYDNGNVIDNGVNAWEGGRQGRGGRGRGVFRENGNYNNYGIVSGEVASRGRGRARGRFGGAAQEAENYNDNGMTMVETIPRGRGHGRGRGRGRGPRTESQWAG